MSRITADLLLVACAAVWGFSFLFQKSAMEHVEPLTFVAARCFVAAAALGPLAWREWKRSSPGLLDKRYLTLSTFTGVAFFAGAALQQQGLVTASVSNAGFLTALYVVATPFVSYAITGRVLTPTVWAATLLSCAGTWLLSGGDLSAKQVLHAGDMLVASSALFWALHVVLLGLGAPLGRPVLFTALQFAVAGIVALAGAALFETISLPALAAGFVDILDVGLLSGALTFTVFTQALRATSPAEAVIILSSEMLFAAFGALVVCGEQMAATAVLGAAAILAAILIVQLERVRIRR